MEGVEFARLRDVDVIAQTVKNLRTVVLRVDHFEGPGFVIGLGDGPLRLGMRVDAVLPIPLSGERRQGTKMSERVGMRRRFGINVVVLQGKLLKNGRSARPRSRTKEKANAPLLRTR